MGNISHKKMVLFGYIERTPSRTFRLISSFPMQYIYKCSCYYETKQKTTYMQACLGE